MPAYQERLRNLDATRYLLKDFLVYGYHMRGDHGGISERSYDNELRRIKALLGDTLKWNCDQSGKRFFISADSSGLSCNPLHRMYRLHTFTDNDILLYFFIPDVLRESGGALDVDALADAIYTRFNRIFDVQTVYRKLGEYVRLGIVVTRREGRRLLYALAEGDILPDDTEGLDEWLAFFREAEPFGSIADEIMLRERYFNLFMRFKHHFLMSTLDDEESLTLLKAMREHSAVCCRIRRQNAGNEPRKTLILPVELRFSEQTGRRYVIAWDDTGGCVRALRMDSIHHAKAVPAPPEMESRRAEVQRLCDELWGVSWNYDTSADTLRMTLRIDPASEGFVLDRLRREGRGGRIEQIDENHFVYENEVADAGEMMEWVKTFIGRICALESSNASLAARFSDDLRRMAAMYPAAEEGRDA